MSTDLAADRSAPPSLWKSTAAPTEARATLFVDLSAIRSNYRRLQELSPHSVCAAVVKADAYGLGATTIASFLMAEGCKHFFVADVEEGIALRAELPATANIYVLHGAIPGQESITEHHNLLPVLNGREQLEAWLRLCHLRGRPLPAAIQLDTGMSRLGFSFGDLRAAYDKEECLSGLPIVLVMSQLACAEQRDEVNSQQLRRFYKVVGLFPAASLSLANSAAIFAGREFHFDMVRSGGGIFGFSGSLNPPFVPAQVLHLQTRIIQVRQIECGDAIGYCHSYQANGTMRIATVAIGYADGVPRSLGNRGHMFIHDVPVPIVGAVSMDLTTIDVTALPEEWTLRGTPVDVICPQQSLETLASQAGMLNDELAIAIGSRCRKVYLSSEAL
ncbi:alanine racemase [Agrobacterium tumefaciens]|uniref:alanine racemase n=1 Tax=Agrobacterium tumefaciens TaxID=358 RepID=UPI000977F5BC|nr:alanine racemase [Agrobacterium tumefaciens]